MRVAVLMHNLQHDRTLHVRAAVHDRAVHTALRKDRAAHAVHNKDHD